MSTETARLQQFKLSIRPWVPSKKIGLFYKNLSLKVAILDIGYFGALNAILVCHSFHVTNKKVLFLLKCQILSQTSGYLCIGAPDRKYQICLNIAVRNATFKGQNSFWKCHRSGTKNFQNFKELRRAYYTSNQGIGWRDNADEDGEDDVGDAGEDVGVEVVGEEELVVGGVTTFAAASSVAPKPHNQKPTSVFSFMPIFFKI